MRERFKVLVCGSRNWGDSNLIYRRLNELREKHGALIVIHGSASGADTAADCWGRDFAAEVRRFPAEWKKHGRRAGPIRNSEMVAELPDLVLAFTHDMARSRGTADTVRKARLRRIAVEVIGEEAR